MDNYQYVVMHNAAAATGNGVAVTVTATGEGAYSYGAIQLEGISGDTVTFEGTIDDSTWYATPATNITSGTAANTATADGIYRLTIYGLKKVRVRISTYSAGAITAIGIFLPQ